MRRRLSSTERPERTHLPPIIQFIWFGENLDIFGEYNLRVMQVQAHSHMTSQSGRTGSGR